jgi:hypothetical protein
MKELEAYKGKKMGVVLYEPIELNGFLVSSLTGSYGGGSFMGPFILNDVQIATAPDKTDVTTRANLKGQTIIFNTENVRAVITN